MSDKKDKKKSNGNWKRMSDFSIGGWCMLVFVSVMQYVQENISSNNELLINFLSGLAGVFAFLVFFLPWLYLIKKDGGSEEMSNEDFVEIQ